MAKSSKELLQQSDRQFAKNIEIQVSHVPIPKGCPHSEIVEVDSLSPRGLLYSSLCLGARRCMQAAPIKSAGSPLCLCPSFRAL